MLFKPLRAPPTPKWRTVLKASVAWRVRNNQIWIDIRTYAQSKHMHVKFQANLSRICPQVVPNDHKITPNGSKMGSKTPLGVPIVACGILGRFWAFFVHVFLADLAQKGGSFWDPVVFKVGPLGPFWRVGFSKRGSQRGFGNGAQKGVPNCT